MFSKTLAAMALLWPSACSYIKILLLLLYVHVFSIELFRIIAYGVMAVVVGGWPPCLFGYSLLCRHVNLRLGSGYFR